MGVYLLFSPQKKKGKSQVLAAQTCAFHPSGHGSGLSGKEPSFHSEAICSSSMRLPQSQINVSFNGPQTHCLYTANAGPLCHTGSQKLNTETVVKGHLAPESPFSQGVVPPPRDLPKQHVPEVQKVLLHTHRPPPCDSLLLVPVPPTTTSLLASMLTQGGCCPTSLRLPHLHPGHKSRSFIQPWVVGQAWA